MRASIAIALLSLLARPALAGVDAPGQVLFDFLAEPDRIFGSFDQIPAEAPFDRAETAEVFFSSDASSFGDKGVLMWAGFALEGDPAGPSYGMLFLDLNLNRAPGDDQIPMPADAVRVEYLEKRGDELLFEGRAVVGDVWIVDIVYHADDKGAVEGDFAFVFEDDSGRSDGCRVLLRGMFLTDPSPSKLRQNYGALPAEGEDGEYVSVGCTGDIYVADDGGGCGGDDDSGGGCDGDTTESGGGCDGDTGDGGGCEGDTGSGCGGDGGGCSGDAGGGACGGSASAAVRPPRRSGGPLRALMRMLPEICGLAFITWMRRRRRR